MTHSFPTRRSSDLDGYLAPYKVIRIDLDRDVLGWRPSAGMTDKYGNLVDDRIYNQSDMNRSLVLEARDQLVAEKITQYLKATDRSEEHTSELQSLMRISYAVFCLKKKKNTT